MNVAFDFHNIYYILLVHLSSTGNGCVDEYIYICFCSSQEWDEHVLIWSIDVRVHIPISIPAPPSEGSKQLTTIGRDYVNFET